MTKLVLDAEAMSALSNRSGNKFEMVKAALRSAQRSGREVVVPAVVLAELYRGSQLSSSVDATMGREGSILVRDTDRSFARLVGGVLLGAGAGSEDMIDAHCVAAAAEHGRGVVVTGDEADLNRLAANYRSVSIVGI
jgi:predicted nucleic acid-binding protein